MLQLANVNKIAIVTFLLQMSSKEERLSRRKLREIKVQMKRERSEERLLTFCRASFRSARRPALISRGYPRVLVTFGYHSEHISRSSRAIPT